LNGADFCPYITLLQDNAEMELVIAAALLVILVATRLLEGRPTPIVSDEPDPPMRR